ncbi:MAG: hypothetical protein COT43_06955 [Candidatus Marinimicrobia bacterium CG08_land_8_20_14_0_20_45_22]|nr:MAG: hypothetical protein COT43_06955 [Candidatus Marinimicrobia bacterium CG08_land_8_20_14_0_20_45_22]
MIQKNRSQPPFVLTLIAMLKDKSWRSLSSNAKVLWIYLRSKYNPNDEKRNLATGKIQVRLSYSEMATVQDFKSPKSMTKALSELKNAGWIEISEQGGLMKGQSAYTFTGKYADLPNQKRKR